MLITRDILNKALEDKVPLFHDGDYIDDDVLYDLFYAQPILKDLPNGKKGLRTLIPRSDRDILCAEMKGYNPKNRKGGFDKIYCSVKCKSCGKVFPIHITKCQIIYKTFKIRKHVHICYGNPGCSNGYNSNYISFQKLYDMKFGKADDVYVCKPCIEKFISDLNQEALEILERKDKFDWFRSDESTNDWRRGLFYEVENSYSIGIKINTINGLSWTDDKYNEWQKDQERKREEERNHQRKLEEIRRQQKQNEEAEREKTRKANELFLARHQLNTPTQRYIDKFCNKDSDIDITDKEIQREALSPEDVNYEAIQKHNSKLYREYLQSPLWKIISSKVKWNANYRCEKCGSTKNLVTHHTSYEFKGIEFLAFHTLQCLCSKCHEKEHEK